MQAFDANTVLDAERLKLLPVAGVGNSAICHDTIDIKHHDLNRRVLAHTMPALSKAKS